MASEQIIVYIDTNQLAAQKANNYSLYLAKKVNGNYTVVWQSKGPLATVTNPAVYEYKNTFNITIPSYQVNYGTVTDQQGAISFSAGGKAVNIDEGQTVELNSQGIFASPTNTGTTGVITINNQLQGNPNAILNDNEGNTIYVNDYSGMDVGQSTLTPIDEYQIWFDSYQNTGTIIAHNVSNAGTVTFSGGVASQTISYTSEGQWVAGDLPSSSDVDLSAVGAATNTLAVQVVALFSKALTAGAVTFLLSKLIDKFADNLRPTTITAGAGNATLKFEFANGPDGDAQVTSMDSYEDAVNDALKALRNEKNSPIANEKWGISEPDVAVFYGN
ncbi:MAG: hypothetical protein JJ908_12780 [Rhizobiales bacterium]|nr:hypothetical protein [Hyphomicrobiales bacterium]MBO6699699.1 hypothetical protein [Hyphomicrobiales bacterium]MBO6737237.1 hypothetical protein [Hyphomicrobiales bacterium]MBO6911689.1 hypothetical protein [Hyphomicrobiales bacterium]MBO6954889.1 hypothetical protein [Hyphomicrobiales bacterium]